MFYDALENKHGMAHDPFKALIVPRPIGWISTVSAAGVANLAPYSFFNAVAEKPHYVVFGSAGIKDSLANIEETKEFVCNIATYELREHMNMSSAAVPRGVDEFPLAGLTAARSNLVSAPRVKEAAAAFECKLHQVIPLPGAGKYRQAYFMVIGMVVGIHIDDRYVKDGMIDTARLGYMDYAVVTPETMFSINRPDVDASGKVTTVPNAWDGKYR
jgi:flavin reductase (DIM6/NTAB) family NADH-FMN oxidoreductase RutF